MNPSFTKTISHLWQRVARSALLTGTNMPGVPRNSDHQNLPNGPDGPRPIRESVEVLRHALVLATKLDCPRLVLIVEPILNASELVQGVLPKLGFYYPESSLDERELAMIHSGNHPASYRTLSIVRDIRHQGVADGVEVVERIAANDWQLIAEFQRDPYRTSYFHFDLSDADHCRLLTDWLMTVSHGIRDISRAVQGFDQSGRRDSTSE